MLVEEVAHAMGCAGSSPEGIYSGWKSLCSAKCYSFSISSKSYQRPPGKAGKSGHGSSNVKVQQEERAALKGKLRKVVSGQHIGAAEVLSAFLQFSLKRLLLALPLWGRKHMMTGPWSFYFEAECLELSA